jgi:hypothetical protein
MGLERSAFSLVNSTDELPERKSSGCGLESQEYGLRDADHVALYPQKLSLTSPTSGGRPVGIVRSRTQTTEFVYFVCILKSLRL